MAKTKNNKLNIIDSAIVNADIPFELPNNWSFIKLKNICSLINGKKIENKKMFYFDVKALRTNNYEIIKNSGYQVEKGNKVILVDGENSSDIFEISQTGYLGSTLKILRISEYVNEVYIKNFIEFNSTLLKKNKKGSAIPHLNKDIFYNLILPLPPVVEQDRIVNILEIYFEKLDEAKDLIQQSLDIFDDRKNAILHKAFSGELTAEWRKENNNNYYKWEKRNFLDCIKIMSNGLSKRKSEGGLDFPVLRLANLNNEEIDTSNVRFIKLTETEIFKYVLDKNDVLLIRVNGTKTNVGKQYIFNGAIKCAVCDHIIRIKYKDYINPKFMLYFSKTSKYKEYVLDNIVCSAGQNTISRKGLMNLNIDIPLCEEQNEIVRILDSFFEKEDKTKELLDMIDKIDEMKKAILAKAFRGELNTNNPEDESAEELVKRILANK